MLGFAVRHRIATPIVLTVALVLGLSATANAAFTSSVSGSSGTLTGDAANDTLTIGVSGGLLRHNRFTAGDANFGSDFDWNTGALGDQTLAADGSTSLTIAAGDGTDTITFTTSSLAAVAINGGGGGDTISATALDDTINGGFGADTINAGDGDDTITWTNGDGSDTIEGEAGYDAVTVSGSPAAGDNFVLQAQGGRARLDRTNLGLFNLSMGTTEAVDLSTLGGNDTVTALAGIAAVLPSLVVDGGSGEDTLTGAEAADVFFGGTDNDTIDPGAGSDYADGGGGNDILKLRDGAGDLGNCGDGTDSAEADSAAVDKLVSCEQADVLPTESTTTTTTTTTVNDPPPAAPAADTVATPVTIGTTAPVRGKGKKAYALVTVGCPATEPGGCVGKLALATASAVRVGKLKAIVQLGTARFSLKAGETKKLKVRLASGYARLAKRRKLAARATALSRDQARNAAESSSKVTLRLPR